MLTKHIYNASRQLVVDSNFHTAVGASTSTRYTIAFTYDAQGRKKTETRLNEFSDSVTHKVYQYQISSNHLEILTKGYSYNPPSTGSTLVVTDYTSSGRVLSEKTYAPVNQLASQTDYTYDTNGNLLKKIYTNLSGNIWEERHINNAFGRPEKVEKYYQNKLSTVTFYYYE